MSNITQLPRSPKRIASQMRTTGSNSVRARASCSVKDNNEDPPDNQNEELSCRGSKKITEKMSKKQPIRKRDTQTKSQYQRQADARELAARDAALLINIMRTKSGMTQQQLADLLGISVSRIGDVEIRRRRDTAKAKYKFEYDNISYAFLHEVADATGFRLLPPTISPAELGNDALTGLLKTDA